MRKKFFTLLVLLAAVVTSAMAQEESLLTTLTFGESETYGETTSGVVTVIATNVYAYNGTYGWLLAEGSSLSVTAKEGYTITKCVFRQNAKAPITDTEAPFEIHTNSWGTIEEDSEEEMNGVTSIEVYGYANAGGGSAATEVIITQDDFPSSYGTSFTKDGVTVSAVTIDGFDGNLMGGGSFSTTLGNFTQIEVTAASVLASGEGWSGNSQKKTWTGNASSVSFSGNIMGMRMGTTLKFTIEPASTPEPEPEPAGVTVVFAANNNTVEKTVTLPHTFKCDFAYENGELDGIIQELYSLEYGGMCHASFVPEATGNAAVTAGKTGDDNRDHYIQIAEAFEGTATVTGYYRKYNVDYDTEEMTYTLTISIKAGTQTAVENVQSDKVQGTKILRDGMLLIEKNGKIYNVMGAEVK